MNDLLEYLDSLLEDGLLGDLGHRKGQKSGHSGSSFPGFELRNSSRWMTSVEQKILDCPSAFWTSVSQASETQ